jgi:hypothetical protein
MTLFSWAVIGAGPAGIAAVGKLLDLGIEPQKIVWIDPEFKVGDLGAKWRNVSSNTRVELFLKFFHEAKSFEYGPQENKFAINNLNPKDTCLLSFALEPLQWITDNLKSKVNCITQKVLQLKLADRHWSVALGGSEVLAQNVILATGSEPKSLSYPGVEEIPLTTALSPEKLKSAVSKVDTIAVFGASHSAMVVMQSLLENCEVKKIINFYLSPLKFAVYFDDYILFDDTGLKGRAAEWAKENINGRLPARLQRIIATEDEIRVHLPLCNKVIYATGFQKRLIPVEGMLSLKHNDRSGIIAPGLFGLGIAFPEAHTDRFGNLEHRVGLWKFIDYLNNVLPVWMKYGI